MGRRKGQPPKTKQHTDVSMPPEQLRAMGFTSLEQLHEAWRQRSVAIQALQAAMARPDLPGPEKHARRCAWKVEHYKSPYTCRSCFLLPGFCICRQLVKGAPRTRVVVSVHHDEWGRGSNTGCLCAASLAGAQFLMRGHMPHDDQLASLLSDPTITTALLWPGEGALEPEQLLALAQARTGGRIALVAVDATWGCAQRMRGKYPADMLMLRLPPALALPELHHCQPVPSLVDPAAVAAAAASNDAASGHNSSSGNDGGQHSTPAAVEGAAAPPREAAAAGPGGPDSSSSQPSSPPAPAALTQQQHQHQHESLPRVAAKRHTHQPAPGERVSLFRPIRKYSGDASGNGRVSTLEAVAAALLALEGDVELYEGQLHNLKLKVDAMRAQKHMSDVYGTRQAQGSGGGAGSSSSSEDDEAV